MGVLLYFPLFYYFHFPSAAINGTVVHFFRTCAVSVATATGVAILANTTTVVRAGKTIFAIAFANFITAAFG